MSSLETFFNQLESSDDEDAGRQVALELANKQSWFATTNEKATFVVQYVRESLIVSGVSAIIIASLALWLFSTGHIAAGILVGNFFCIDLLVLSIFVAVYKQERSFADAAQRQLASQWIDD